MLVYMQHLKDLDWLQGLLNLFCKSCWPMNCSFASWFSELSNFSRWFLKNLPHLLAYLTYYSTVLLFYTPWKHQKTWRLLMFSGGIEKQHRPVMSKSSLSKWHSSDWIIKCSSAFTQLWKQQGKMLYRKLL